jgi:alkylation response protein AidB-like acyl-CoA dehydrogenase
MRFSFTEDERLFAATLRELLTKECPATRVRAAWDDGTGHAADVWAQLGAMGLLGLLLPEREGGAGGTEIDLVLLLVELGRAGVPGPVLEHAAVVAPALADTSWAAGLASGELVATAWLDGPYAPHAGAAHLILTPGGVVEAFTPTDAAGIDGGRRIFTVATDGPATEVAGLDVALAADRAALGAAAVLIGVALRLLDLAADHARQRHQFGRPIGSFQAVKHLLANALVKVDFAQPAVERAAWSVAAAQPTRARDVSMAKALASEAALQSARAAIQVHGALGYTWECDVQLFAKKAWALAAAYGDARHHRRRVADAVLGPRRAGSDETGR